MRHLSSAFALVLMLGAGQGTVSHAQANGNLEDLGAAERVNYSGLLRTLSQSVATAACNLNAGVAIDRSRELLVSASTEFHDIIHALQHGDPDKNIHGAETRRKTLEAIAVVEDKWTKVGAAAETLLSDSNAKEAAEIIAAKNLDLLDRADRLVTEVSGQYSNPVAMLQADAVVLNIAGRQRTLIKKMSKEACLIWSGDTSDSARARLQGTADLFETSLLALRDGLPAVGVYPAPTPDIHDGLSALFGQWEDLKPTLAKAMAGETASVDERAHVKQTLATFFTDMNAIVHLYSDQSKTGL